MDPYWFSYPGSGSVWLSGSGSVLVWLTGSGSALVWLLDPGPHWFGYPDPDPFKPSPLHEVCPDLRPEPVAEHEPDTVLALVLALRRVQQVSVD
jgi:hypothetical protein